MRSPVPIRQPADLVRDKSSLKTKTDCHSDPERAEGEESL